MKRILNLLLVALLAASVGTPAFAAKRRKKAAQPPAPIEMTAPPANGLVAATNVLKEKKQVAADPGPPPVVSKPSPEPHGKPTESHLTKAPGSGKKFDLRHLPHTPPVARERNELEPPPFNPVLIGTPSGGTSETPVAQSFVFRPAPNVAAPPPNNVFEGLDRFNWGAGSPPDTNGDVGPTHYIQTVNSSIGVFRKSDGFMEAAFTFDTFMSQGSFGNLCDTNNFGDPVVLYDTFEDRWIITDFAFLTSGGNPVAPAYQCVAVSLNGDPIAGGWNFYSIQISDFLNDYPKFGIWPDGLYMSANLFTFGGGVFSGARAWAFNKSQMYAGAATVKIVSFDVGNGDFTVIPSNARLQAGSPPPGRPNFFVGTSTFLNALSVYKFHVDWNDISLSTFTGPDVPTAGSSWPNSSPANVPQSGTSQLLDSLAVRAMVQNQYTNFGGTESLWVPHTVRRQDTSGFAAPRWYQVNVNGGTVAGTLPQATTWDPDGSNVTHRWMPSLALDRAGNLAMGYSTSSGSTFPSIKYAGRLAADPVNTFSLTEQSFFTGTASQLSSTRWGDYSAMTLDPDGCTFWYTNEYATGLDNTTVDPTSFNKRWKTKFGSFGPFPGCTPVGGGGTVSGVVTRLSDNTPIQGATVAFGARSATTDSNGNYGFSNIPAGNYQTMTASFAGFASSTSPNIAVTDGNTTTQNFALAGAPPSACMTDTTQGDFLTGVPTNVDLNVSPGDVVLSPAAVDQYNAAGTSTGTGFGTPTWTGQTFTAAMTAQLVKADVQVFCSGCGATPPNLTLSVRATSGGVPTGADLTSTTIPGTTFSSGSAVVFTATFASPVTLTSGTKYALVIRPVSTPAGAGYFWVRSSPATYAGGTRVTSTDSGSTWATDTNRTYNFKTYMRYPPSGTLVSSLKDANPATGLTPIWSTLSWNASVPANTSVSFQVAGSNSSGGPFNFVGPDGTAGTFFTTSPASLSQFYNLRYLEYKAILSTTDFNQTPVLNDVTACFNDVDCSVVPTSIVATPPQVCSNTAGNTASGPAGMTTYAWGIANGTITSATTGQSITYTAGASGTVTLTLSMTAPNGCMVSGSQPVTINPLPEKPVITGTLTFCPGNMTTLTSSAPGGNQWYLGGNPIGGATNQTYDVTTAGSYTVQVTDPNNCVSPTSDPAVVTQDTLPPTPTISADTNGTGTQDQACPEVPLTLHANGATGAVSYQWYSNNDTLNGETSSTYAATGAATYYVTATDAAGCTTVQSAGYVVQNPTPHSPFISFRNQSSSVTTLAICQGTSQIIDSDSATGIQWYKDGIAIPGANNQSYTATQAGVYTAQLDALGCHSQFGRNVTLTIDAMPPTPTISGDTNGTGTQDQACPEQPLTLHANGATGAQSYQWYSDNAPIGDGTATLVMTGVGNISVTATNGSCTTAHSATYVVQNPTPHKAFISIIAGTNPFCAGSSVTLWSDSATGIQWYKDSVAIPGPQQESLVVTQAGSYTVLLNALGCHSQMSDPFVVTVNPLPPTPTINTGGPTTFCQGGSVTLTSSSASGNQWKLNGSPIGGATGVSYNATASGSYTVTVTDGNGCTATSSATTVTVNPTPATPTINAGGPTTFCAGGSVTLTSSSASGNQWKLNGSPIGGATSQTYIASVAGDYTVVVTDGNGCVSATSATTTVTVNPNPNATITAPGSVVTGSTGNSASVASAGAGATYNWSITNGTITAGTGTNAITFTAGAVGTLTLQVTVTTSAGCSDTKSANVTVALPTVTVTSVTPNHGSVNGGLPVTIGGTGFQSGATVTFGGTTATNIVFVNATTITAKTPAHAGGAVNVVVTNTNTASGTLTNGFTYVPQRFDPNGDNTIDPSDIFYLVNWLFTNGPAPAGAAGMMSGDANGDGVVDPSDIFFTVNYLFDGGYRPQTVAPVSDANAAPLAGSVSLGTPFTRDGRTIVPVLVTGDSAASLSLRVTFNRDVQVESVHRTTGMQPAFEINRTSSRSLAYLVTYGGAGMKNGVVAEIELAKSDEPLVIAIDPALTLLSDGGAHSATVGNGRLTVHGTAIGATDHDKSRDREN